LVNEASATLLPQCKRRQGHRHAGVVHRHRQEDRPAPPRQVGGLAVQRRRDGDSVRADAANISLDDSSNAPSAIARSGNYIGNPVTIEDEPRALDLFTHAPARL